MLRLLTTPEQKPLCVDVYIVNTRKFLYTPHLDVKCIPRRLRPVRLSDRVHNNKSGTTKFAACLELIRRIFPDILSV